jgi:hypothetical protein
MLISAVATFNRGIIMVLIEYGRGVFVNAERIDTLDVSDGVRFTLTGDETCFAVENNLESSFVNNLQDFNCNMQNVEKSYWAIQDSKLQACI